MDRRLKPTIGIGELDGLPPEWQAYVLQETLNRQTREQLYRSSFSVWEMEWWNRAGLCAHCGIRPSARGRDVKRCETCFFRERPPGSYIYHLIDLNDDPVRDRPPNTIVEAIKIAIVRFEAAQKAELEALRRFCRSCNAEITHLAPTARRCTDCSGVHLVGIRRHLPELMCYQEGLCTLCGKPLPDDWLGENSGHIHVDHKQPRSKGGSDEIGNLQAVHAFCNLSKGDRWVMETKN